MTGPLYDIAGRLEPELRAGFCTFPDAIDAASDPPAARAIVGARFAASKPPSRPDVVHRDYTIDGAGGEVRVPVRVYEPRGRAGVLPAILYVHGGGFIIGSVDAASHLCEQLAEEIDAVVVSVGYRLAPEHPFPAAPDDAYAALRWTAGSAAELDIDVTKIAVVGHSAGGGITAAVALMARDRGEIEIAIQAPICACLDDRHTTRSSETIRDPRTWHRDRAQRAWAAYLGDEGTGEVSIYAAPARASDLSGLAPAFMTVGDLDLLCDENLEYARRLAEAGVATELHLYAGAFHGFEMLLPDARISQAATAALHAALRRKLHPTHY